MIPYIVFNFFLPFFKRETSTNCMGYALRRLHISPQYICAIIKQLTKLTLRMLIEKIWKQIKHEDLRWINRVTFIILKCIISKYNNPLFY